MRKGRRIAGWFFLVCMCLLLAGCRGRGGAKLGQGAAKAGQGAKDGKALTKAPKGAQESNGIRKEAEELAVDYAKAKAEEELRKAREAERPPVRPAVAPARFPHPASSVRPEPGSRPVYDQNTGLYSQPNNYGGRSFYNAAGNPVGFSARNTTTGSLDFFDAYGNRQ